MQGCEEASQDGRPQDGWPQPGTRTRCRLPRCIYLRSSSSFPILPMQQVSGCALSPFEVLQPFSPLSINNKKRELIAS